LKQCEHFAARLQKAKRDVPAQVEEAFLLALNRKPTPDEVKKLGPFVEKHGLASFCRLIFNMSEFMFVD
jgi:hypothetical protein